MEQKRSEMRMLNRRQQQQPSTIHHQHQTDNDQLINAEHNQQHEKKDLKQAVERDRKNALPLKDDVSKVPLFTRPEKSGTLPAAGRWKTSGEKTPAVEKCKTARGNGSRKAGLSSGDDGTKNGCGRDGRRSSSQRVPHPPVQQRGPTAGDGRCTSAARVGRRGRDAAGPSARSQRVERRPRSSIGTRLEPQGAADHLDPVTAELNSPAAESRQDDRQGRALEVADPKRSLKDSLASRPVVTSVSAEFHARKTSVTTELLRHPRRASEDQKVIREEQDTSGSPQKCEKRSTSSCDSLGDTQGQDRGIDKVSEDQKSMVEDDAGGVSQGQDRGVEKVSEDQKSVAEDDAGGVGQERMRSSRELNIIDTESAPDVTAARYERPTTARPRSTTQRPQTAARRTSTTDSAADEVADDDTDDDNNDVVLP